MMTKSMSTSTEINLWNPYNKIKHNGASTSRHLPRTKVCAIRWKNMSSTVVMQTRQYPGGDCDWSISSVEVSDAISRDPDVTCTPHGPPYKYIMSRSDATSPWDCSRWSPSARLPVSSFNHRELWKALPSFKTAHVLRLWQRAYSSECGKGGGKRHSITDRPNSWKLNKWLWIRKIACIHSTDS